MKLQNKNALITGASRGIGREIALAFAREGADVGLNYLNSKDAAEELALEIRNMGRKAITIQADVSTVEPTQNMVATMLKKVGSIDILV